MLPRERLLLLCCGAVCLVREWTSRQDPQDENNTSVLVLWCPFLSHEQAHFIGAETEVPGNDAASRPQASQLLPGVHTPTDLLANRTCSLPYRNRAIFSEDMQRS